MMRAGSGSWYRHSVALRAAEKDGVVARAKRADIVDVVRESVKLTRAGRDWKGLCPFHAEKSPSFTLVPGKGFFHCFGCGAHGDAIEFVMRRDNVDFLQACHIIAGAGEIPRARGVARTPPPSPLPTSRPAATD